MNHTHDITVMIVIMFMSGFLSTMNVFADSYRDMRFSLNDLYMTMLMTGWMLFFMGIYYKNKVSLFIGGFFVGISLVAIRLQLFIDEKQYVEGMIPHHSMAVFVTKKFLEKKKDMSDTLRELTTSIVKTQTKEIQILKSLQ